MLAYVQGDAAAFETLYRRHRGPLYRFVLRAIKQRSAAEELFQEVWIRVIESRSRYAPQARFTTWLYTIAHNLLVDHWRKKGLSIVALDTEDVALESANPARQVEARESLARFLDILEKLPAAQREAFLMHQEAGLSVAEIAAEVGYESEPSFNRAFKRQFGLPPARYRSQIRTARRGPALQTSPKRRATLPAAEARTCRP